MSEQALFAGYEPSVAPEPVEAATKHTERSMLDLIHARYSKIYPGNSVRYVVAEHVRNGLLRWLLIAWAALSITLHIGVQTWRANLATTPDETAPSARGASA